MSQAVTEYDDPVLEQEIAYLIIEAAGRLGSEYKLAQHLGITSQELSGMKHGRRACPVDVQTVMAAIAGKDAVATLVEATADRLSPERRKRFEDALNWRKL